ncbi:zf-HC2 domain-containing protein [Solwaraspora sp. WMMB335]|uniref:zf-HC2 domain-containing protein n=1 Tax=Solwaraspora sp. WMMB335 TaxID=3404118 RepID=UPI003B94E197
MDDAACRDPDLRALLGFYVIGKLDDGELTAVERHLAGCPACRAARDEVGLVVPALRLLGETDVRDLVAEFGVPTAAGTVRAPRQGVDQLAVDELDTDHPDGGQSAADRPAVADGPGGGRPAARSDRRSAPPGRPGATKRRQRRWQLSIGGLLVLVLAGALAMVVVQWPESVAPQPAGIIASGDSSAGATITVEIDGRTVRATLYGLRDGVRYELYAVTGDGKTYRVAELTGTPDAQDVDGLLPVPADAVMFFSVRQADGAVVVTAEVGGTDPTDPPR